MYNTNIKAILFDMDGVVIDSERLYSSSEKKLLAKYGVKFDSNDWNYIKGCTESQFYDLIYKSSIVIVTTDYTTLKELFTINHPTIILWDKKYFSIRDPATKLYNQLEKAGILFSRYLYF